MEDLQGPADVPQDVAAVVDRIEDGRYAVLLIGPDEVELVVDAILLPEGTGRATGSGSASSVIWGSPPSVARTSSVAWSASDAPAAADGSADRSRHRSSGNPQGTGAHFLSTPTAVGPDRKACTWTTQRTPGTPRTGPLPTGAPGTQPPKECRPPAADAAGCASPD